jgi:exopolyphosphatase/guanosine-5'-triphosphate,3'-diphosphate pyrophosphatase
MSADRVAVVDCGTNTIRLLIADLDDHGQLLEVERRMEIVRLGQDVDRTGRFHPEALQRTFAATKRYAAVIAEAGVARERIRFVATSASRDVANRDVFFAWITERLGVVPDVITGDDEAMLSFFGALSGIRDPRDPILVADIGGGSTELIIGRSDGVVDHAVSLDVGSVRITERFWTADPPTEDDLERATATIDALLDQLQLEQAGIQTWVGVAGTLTTMAAIDLGLQEYDRDKVHGHRIALEDLYAITDRLSAATVEEIRGIGSVHPQRADVITGGALIAARIARRLRIGAMTVSETDILDGTALQMFAADGRLPG